MKPILSAWLLAISPLAAVPATTTLTLINDPSFNKVSVTIDPGFGLADTETTTMTGTTGARFDINPQAATTTELTLSDGRANGTNMTFSKSVFFGAAAYNLTVANVSAAFKTITPPGLVTPATGQFAADQHEFKIDQGTATGSTSGALIGNNTINESFTPENPASGKGSGTGTVALVPAGDSGAYRTFNVTVTMPISIADSFVTSGITVNITATGTLKATGTVQVPIGPQPLIWTGAGGNNWTTSGLQNFSNDGTTPRWFFAGDHVTFNDTATDKNVVFGGPLQPGSITFQHNQNYTATGAGPITGSTGLTKKGTGMLTIGGDSNSFTGPVSVEAGILRLQEGQGGALGDNSGVTIASGAQVNLNGQFLDASNSFYHYRIAGAGANGLGAITNSSGTNIDEHSGIRHLTLTGNASIGGSTGRFDVGLGGTVNGSGFTLTKVGSNSMGFRGVASGSPINFIIASGRAWAENTNAAWGGATGTLTIKNGARGGSYGDLSIATPVTIESGGILHNQGGGTGTWTGAISLAGNAAVESDSPINLNGPVTGTANLIKTGTSLTTIAQPGWTGNTTVSAGTLRLNQATLGTSSTVSIAATSVLHLGFSGTQEVAILRIAGVDQPHGIYNASHPVHGARFAGTGSLRIGPALSGYALWAEQIISEGSRPFDSDADNDGIPNGLEYVLNGNPGSGSDRSILPTLDAGGASSIKFIFFRKAESTADTVQTVQYGGDLLGWTDVPVHPSPAPGVVVEDQGGGVSKVTVTINKLAAPRLLVRLKVTQP